MNKMVLGFIGGPSFNRKIALQLFNDNPNGGGAGDPPGAGGAGDPPGGAGGGAGDPPGAGGENKPFATFPDEASFMARVSRDAKKQFNDLLKGLGFENQNDLKTIVDAHKATIEQNKTDLQKAQEAATAANNARDAAIAKANGILLQSEAKLQAIALGIKPERIDYALKLAALSDVSVTDGNIDSVAVKAALEDVIKNLPELKGAATLPSAGGSDFGGDKGGAGGNPPLTYAIIDAMSTKEAESRMDEIMAFMTKNPKR